MSQLGSFEDALDRLRDGDQDAAAEVFQRFASRLIRLASTRLDSSVRRHLDPEDVVQSVFRSFFARQAQGEFELENWNSLWSLLVQIAVRKCGRQIAALHAARRDVRREVSPESSSCVWEALAHEPTAEEVASLTEIVEHLMANLDERQQQIVGLRLQGCTVLEISAQVGCTERTAQRVLATVRKGLTRMAHDT